MTESVNTQTPEEVLKTPVNEISYDLGSGNNEIVNLAELQVEYRGETQEKISKLVNEIKQGELDIEYEYGVKVPELNQSEKEELFFKVGEIKRDNKFALPPIFKGNPTATKYSHAGATNYSTITKNVTLESGKELFVIYNYRSSGVHRFIDTTYKKIVGTPMRKANYKEWPETFRKNSLLPVLDLVDNNGKVDRNIIVLERIPNINMYDFITNLDVLKNPDSKVDGCDFVKDMGKEDLMKMVGGVAGEIAKIHNKDKTWGDLVPSNIIIDKNQKIHICDPEMVYNEKLSINEQKAHDLLECVTSFSALIKNIHQIPYIETINTILGNYMASTQNSESVIVELKKIAGKKFTLINKLAFGYLMAHYSVHSLSELTEIRKNITDFDIKTN
jgi:tRNA A-37 threonylcarbamoyl transferase component Bud32